MAYGALLSKEVAAVAAASAAARVVEVQTGFAKLCETIARVAALADVAQQKGQREVGQHQE